MLIIYEKHFFKLIPKSISKFPKLQNFENDKSYLESCFFLSLPSISWHFQQQLMTKSEMRVGFRLLGNHKYIASKISLNKQKYQTEKKDVSPSLSHLHGQTWSVNFE